MEETDRERGASKGEKKHPSERSGMVMPGRHVRPAIIAAVLDCRCRRRRRRRGPVPPQTGQLPRQGRRKALPKRKQHGSRRLLTPQERAASLDHERRSPMYLIHPPTVPNFTLLMGLLPPRIDPFGAQKPFFREYSGSLLSCYSQTTNYLLPVQAVQWRCSILTN